MQQHISLGRKLREEYLISEQLLDEQCPDLSLRVQTYTSHQDRALMSAQRYVRACMFCVCVCACVCVRACVCACVRVCVTLLYHPVL